MNSAGFTVIFRKLARFTGESFNKNWAKYGSTY